MIALEQHPPVFVFAVTPALVAEGVASAMAMSIVGQCGGRGAAHVGGERTPESMSLTWSVSRGERRFFWVAVLTLCAIAVAISIRRLVLLVGLPANGDPDSAALDAFFAAKRLLTGGHVLSGLVLAAAIPVQLSARVRRRYLRVHRWLGRLVLFVGLLIGVSAYGMMFAPVVGWLETSTTSLYDAAFLTALVTAWWHIRRGDVTHHREWMLRAIGVVLGAATTRPVMAIFFATSTITGLRPPQFFGVAMWIGFTSTVLATEWYIRGTKPRTSIPVDVSDSESTAFVTSPST